MPPMLTAREAVRQVAAGEISVEAIARAQLARIAATEPRVQAWAHLDEAAVIAAAQRLDSSDGALRGLTFGIKDVIDTAAMPTAHGSAAYAGNQPLRDASVVAIARAAGALAMGKTVTAEFAGISPGPTRNPHNPAHTPGGSSSGSAAAVAAGMVPLALGTQTAGSTIRPAAFCGVVGYKPSYDLIDTAGIKSLVRDFDTVGIFANDVADAAFFAAALSGDPALREIHPSTALRFGLFRTAGWDQAEPATEMALERAIAALGKAGIAVTDIPVSQSFHGFEETYQPLFDNGICSSLAYERLFRSDELTPVTRAFLANGAAQANLQATRTARTRLAVHRAIVEKIFTAYDVLLTPAAPGEAPAGLSSTGNAIFNRCWTMLHMPCVTLPVTTGANGLPIGVQLVGPCNRDATILTAAITLEAALARYA